MMDNDTMKKIADAVGAIVQDTLTTAGYKISDLVNGYPENMRFIVLAGMQLTINSLKERFNYVESSLFDNILRNTTSIVLPGEFDPRKKGGTAE